MQTKEEESLLSTAASLLGTKGGQTGIRPGLVSVTKGSNPDASARSKLLLACFSKRVEGSDVVYTVPSLDMKKADDDGGPSPLPRVGEHHSSANLEGQHPEKRPRMDASVLSTADPADASEKAAQLEQKAAQSLGTPTSWTKSSLVYAPGAIAKNVADSFTSLVESRVRAWTLLLLRHSLTTGDTSSRSRLLSMLSSIIDVESADTMFKTLPLPDAAKEQLKDADVLLPVLLTIELNTVIQGTAEPVTLRAPGTITGIIDKDANSGPPLLKRADITLDTGALLDSMVQQARMVVFKAVAKATAAADSKVAVPDSMAEEPALAGSGIRAGISAQPTATLSAGFRSALSLSAGSKVPAGPHEPTNHRLQKAKSSALRLNKVLEGSYSHAGDDDKMRKNRSVQWDQSLLNSNQKQIPSPKRQRVVAQTTARLTSFKSFGRPHAGDFGSGPRNATFGDFGRKPIWGRDGKLANHPKPMMSREHQQEMLAGPAATKANARFDLGSARPSIHLMSSGGLGLGVKSSKGQGSSGGGGLQKIPSALPRTATALEGFMLKNMGADSPM